MPDRPTLSCRFEKSQPAAADHLRQLQRALDNAKQRQAEEAES